MVRTLVSLSVGLMVLVGTTALAQGTRTDQKYMSGKIVRVDPATGVVVIRPATPADAKDIEYRTGTTTRWYGDNGKAVSEGIRYSGWRPGTEIHYQVGTGANNRDLTGMWLGPVPTAPPAKR